MNGLDCGLSIFHGTFHINLMNQYRVHQRRPSLRSKNNTPPSMRTYCNTRNNYQVATKQRQEYAMNGMLCKGGVLSIGKIF